MRSPGLPYPPYLWKVACRSALVWVPVRIAAFIVMWWADGFSAALHPVGGARAGIVVLTAYAVWWDRRIARELLLPANLGARPVWFWAASLLAAAAMDVVVQALLRAL